MIYYGSNDYRDYLAHHGVVGMHWGIRRYQPYGIGYQRKGGESGKFLGKNSSSQKNLRNISKSSSNNIGSSQGIKLTKKMLEIFRSCQPQLNY